MTIKVDPVVGYADPVFRIETFRDPIHESGSRGIITTCGTKLFVFDKEIPNLEKLSYSTDYGDYNSVPRTTITITIAGAQVVTEFVKEKIDGPQDKG